MSFGCGCEGTAHDWDCFVNKRTTNIGVYDVMKLDISWNCSSGRHEWLPWAQLNSGVLATRCIHCGREERIGP